jgi:hypothetical protein
VKLGLLREQAWEKESDVVSASNVAAVSNVAATSNFDDIPDDWILFFNDGGASNNSGAETRSFITNTFDTPSSEHGTAFKIRIKQIEKLVNHSCHEIKAVPEGIKITIEINEKNTKIADMAKMINRAYDPHSSKKHKACSSEELKAATPPMSSAHEDW